MKASIVKPGDIAAIIFDSGTLIILEDDVAFGDEDVFRSIASQADQARPSIQSLPSVPFPVRDKLVCTCICPLRVESKALPRPFGACLHSTFLAETKYFQGCRFINLTKLDLSCGIIKDSRDLLHIVY